jgi:hypothetical protein
LTNNFFKYNLKVYDQIPCNTRKDIVSHCDDKGRTRGVLIGAYNCGIVCGFREIFGIESVSQVIIFYLDIIKHCYDVSKLPKYFVYDDACHLAQTLNAHRENYGTDIGKILLSKKHFIDKLHIQNHTATYCLQHHNPFKEPFLKDVNSVVCEQFNF